MAKGILSVFTRWKLSYPDLGIPWVYLEIGPSSVKIKHARIERSVPFDSLELNEMTGTLTARRGELVALHAVAERT